MTITIHPYTKADGSTVFEVYVGSAFWAEFKSRKAASAEVKKIQARGGM